MSYSDLYLSPKSSFLVFGTADPKHVFEILKRCQIKVWNNTRQCEDVIENKTDIANCAFPQGRIELDEELVAYSGTECGMGVVVGIDLNENVLENRTLRLIREDAIQIMREHGAYVMPTDLGIIYGKCS